MTDDAKLVDDTDRNVLRMLGRVIVMVLAFGGTLFAGAWLIDWSATGLQLPTIGTVMVGMLLTGLVFWTVIWAISGGLPPRRF